MGKNFKSFVVDKRRREPLVLRKGQKGRLIHVDL